MQAFRRRLRIFTWMALGAFLGLAVAPSFSRALNAVDSSAPWLTVCSSSGAAGPSSDTPRGDLPLHQHCPLCGAHSSAVALLQSQPWKFVPADGACFAPSFSGDAQQVRIAWMAAAARAPPARA